MNIKQILLASHGTPGACAAEQAVFQYNFSQLHHLIVVPDFWKGMLGDDWLNNAITQINYGTYLEGELEKDIQTTVNRVHAMAEERSIIYNTTIKMGKPAECLIEIAKSANFDLIIIGSPRPKHEDGIKSRMDCEMLVHGLSIPLLIVPSG
jgi:nucleotide-binding universal stress UspA family protein